MVPIFSDGMPSFSDIMVFGFLDENFPLSGDYSDSSTEEREWGDEEDKEENSASPEEQKTFWGEQEKLLQGALFRTSSVESRVRNAIKEGMKKLQGGTECNCRRPVGESCRDCLRREIFNHLCNVGFNCSIRKSKWKSSHKIPSGEHIYLEVAEKPRPEKGEIRVVIELNFKAEFEMAAASQEYNQLIEWLPEVYIGKLERLRNVIKILCGAAKKCMKEKRMHLGPWRKYKYMQSKWFGQCNESIIPANTTSPAVAVKYPDPQAKRRASMLTLSLLDKLQGTNCQAVAVA